MVGADHADSLGCGGAGDTGPGLARAAVEEAGAADCFRLLLDGRHRDALGYNPCALRKNEGGLGSLWSLRSPEPPRLSLGTRGGSGCDLEAPPVPSAMQRP